MGGRIHFIEILSDHERILNVLVFEFRLPYLVVWRSIVRRGGQHTNNWECVCLGVRLVYEAWRIGRLVEVDQCRFDIWVGDPLRAIWDLFNV